jgi:hypothetical protein
MGEASDRTWRGGADGNHVDGLRLVGPRPRVHLAAEADDAARDGGAAAAGDQDAQQDRDDELPGGMSKRSQG